MDKRKNIMIIDLRKQSDEILIKLCDMFSNNQINWTWLDIVVKDYECPKIKHLHGCNCCDGVSHLKEIIKKKLVGDFEK